MARSAPPNLPRVAPTQARRLLLAAQGLLARPERATADRVHEMVLRLGYVQIDSINVVERAHHLILGSRLRGYRPSLLQLLLERQRRLFEHWTHDAAAIPAVWYPHWHARFERYRRELPRRPWWRQRLGDDAESVVARVRARVERHGPLAARDVGEVGEVGDAGEVGGAGARAAPGPEGSWWGWSPEKAALEFLWWTGELAIAGRRGFQKLYDLAARVLPEAVALPRPGAEAHEAWACGTAIERLGVATPREIAGFWQALPVSAAAAWCAGAAARGEISAVTLETADGSPPRPAFAVRDWQDRVEAGPAGGARQSRRSHQSQQGSRLLLLCPFDPILRDRRRTQRLFGFDFRFEAFVPRGQRRHGYYVMPVLEGDRLVGRIDPKLHRGESRLEVQTVLWEPGVRPSKRRTAALDAAVGRLASLAGADRWTLPA